MLNQIIHGDCLEIMPQIPTGSVDMILCDLPYGTTACSWDTLIPFEPLWEQYERVIKDNGAIVLTASQPFTSALVMSNAKLFKYEWVWNKTRPSNFVWAKKHPLKYHENVCVFYKEQPMYSPIMTKGEKNHRTKKIRTTNNIIGHTEQGNTWSNTSDLKYPSSVIRIKSEDSTKNVHPTQKPVDLFEYLIKTYTNEGETVLDNCIGSGTTAIAALSCGRNFIGIEKEFEYVDAARKRLQVIQPVMNF